MKTIQHSLANPDKIARHFARIAVQSLYDELALFPKPGLVSFVDSGAHEDMDGTLFYRSLFSLRHYFYQIGMHAALGYPARELVSFGLKAERTMHTVTVGINTHRGAIFSLGILCASICKLSSQTRCFSTEELHHYVIEYWADYLLNEHQIRPSHGQTVKEKYGFADATQLAINGYKVVFDVFDELDCVSRDDKTVLGLQAYHRLFNQLDDLNVLYRTGPEGLSFAREQLEAAFSKGDEKIQMITQALRLHHLFSSKNISPGGVADMLGLIYFLNRVFGTS
jgi:triphosphoribosyl-dephospho-CoA synthase